MDRRFFNKTIFSGLAIAGFSTGHYSLNAFNDMSHFPVKSRKASRLKKGDTIGLIAPGSAVTAEKIQTAVLNLEGLGFKVKMGKHLEAKKGYLAGTDEQRLEDLHQMFADTQVKGIWSARGGYGCTRLLPFIDYSVIKKNPKVLIGYSDITALLQAIYKETGLIGFHGPVASTPFNNYVNENIQAVLMEPKANFLLKNAAENQQQEDSVFKTQVIRSGQASGCLVGGNLSLIAAMVGTKYEWKVKNRILFLEDIGEKPYRIDRMLTQLIQAYPIQKAAAIVLGIFKGCEAKEGSDSLSLLDTLKDRLMPLNIPVIYGMSFGHIDHQFVLPVGIPARLDTQTATLQLLEAGVL